MYARWRALLYRVRRSDIALARSGTNPAYTAPRSAVYAVFTIQHSSMRFLYGCVDHRRDGPSLAHLLSPSSTKKKTWAAFPLRRFLFHSHGNGQSSVGVHPSSPSSRSSNTRGGPSTIVPALMCNVNTSRDEAHTKLPRQHRQDVGLLFAIQPFATLDKTVYRFR